MVPDSRKMTWPIAVPPAVLRLAAPVLQAALTALLLAAGLPQECVLQVGHLVVRLFGS